VVIAAIGVLVGIKVAGDGSSTKTSPGSTTGGGPALTPAQAGITSLPASASAVLDAPISALASASRGATVASLSGGSTITGRGPLVADGKPELLYIGAGYCPYCAAERWAVVAALAKFGTFSNLGATSSSSNDTNPSTPTFSFYQSTYSSPYLTFTPIELTTQDPSQKLQSPSPAQAALWRSLDAGQSIPFIDFANRYLILGATYDSSSMSRTTFDAVAAQVGNNTTTAGLGIDQTAGAIIKTICSLTGDRPAAVCSAV